MNLRKSCFALSICLCSALFADDVQKVGHLNLRSVGSKTVLADESGTVLSDVAPNEEIQDRVTNKMGDVVVLRLGFMQRKGDGTRSFTYSRLLVVHTRLGTPTARNALVFSEPFMKEGKKWIRELRSVSEDGTVISANVGMFVNGKYVYQDKKIQLRPPKLIE
jgi:hypothetical protein